MLGAALPNMLTAMLDASAARFTIGVTKKIWNSATRHGSVAVASWWLLLSVALPALTQFRGGPWVWLSKNVVFGIRVIDHPGKEPRRQRGQRPSAYPPPYPNGWFRIGGSWQLAIKGVQPLRVLGHDLVLYRTESGVARVMDAYCPHLGAHLGVDGTVVRENIRCPFHGWELGPQGQCVHVPGCAPGGSLPAVAVRTWHVTEAWDSIFLWHHAEGLSPQWDLLVDTFNSGAAQTAEEEKSAATTTTPEQEMEKFYFAGHTSAVVHTHIQEIPENGADVAHLGILHEDLVLPQLRWLLRHRWTASWRPCKSVPAGGPGTHMTEILLTQQVLHNGRTPAANNTRDSTYYERQSNPMTEGSAGGEQASAAAEGSAAVLSKPRLIDATYNTDKGALQVPLTYVSTRINQIGPGIVRLRIKLLNRFTIIVHEYVTPTGPTTQRAVHTLHATHGTPRYLAQSALSMLDAQFMRDHPIWESKRYEPNPCLSVMDGPIAAYRRWYGDFYGPSSVPFPEAVAKESMLEPW